MTGGGFGGCTVNLVAASDTETFRREVALRYERETSISPQIYVCSPANGAAAGVGSEARFAVSGTTEKIVPSKSS
jgi:galactokinase